MKIVEVGPRDGLQNETALIPTGVKIAYVDALSETGVDEIEASAFVSPRWVPQLDDAAAVFKGISRAKKVVYSALVPNEKGLARAIRARVDKVSLFTAASETFNRKNINTSIAGSLQRFLPVVAGARRERLPVRAYVSTAFWCAFEGRIAPEAVVDLVNRLVDMGVGEVSISDTVGKATPDEVRRLLDVLLPLLPAKHIAMHFHDTYGRGVANVLAAWSDGIRTFDASAGGLGGCPYAPGASGNVATEDVVTALEGKGVDVDVDLEKLHRASALLTPYLVDDLRSMPEADAPVCAACQFSTGDVCCQRYQRHEQ
jgi:hydroxymethylglutaryl-CoA lyase